MTRLGEEEREIPKLCVGPVVCIQINSVYLTLLVDARKETGLEWGEIRYLYV